jgi:hypothetical protein
MLRVTFKDQSTKNSFSDRFPNLCTNVDGTDDKLDIPLNLLQFAKLDDNALDYDDLESNEVREYIVKGDPTKFSKIAEVEQDLGNGFYLVKTHEGTILGDFVDSIEHNGPAMGFSGNTSTMHDMNVATPDIDPTSSDAQWARLRVASRYRPLLKTFNTHEMTFLSKPELYIMDSGIDFSHP